MNVLDQLHAPLSGVNLIDASAGTGKTYAICGLVLRLLLEKELAIRQILVVTYTEAATEDLRLRIREKISAALAGLAAGSSDDDIIRQLIDRYAADDPGRLAAKQRLHDALRDFDEAAIFTIHGFCRQMLRENSFATGFLFDCELLADQAALRREIVEDFWRRLLYEDNGFSDLFAEYIYKRMSPDSLLAFLDAYHNQPGLQIIPELSMAGDCTALQPAEQAFCAALDEVCMAWPAARQDVANALLNSSSLNRKIYSVKKIPDWLAAMDSLVVDHARGRVGPDFFPAAFEKFTAAAIARAVKKDQQPLSLPFFDLGDNLAQARAELLARFELCGKALQISLFDQLNSELAARKMKNREFSFDDLLNCLHRALNSTGGPGLARAILRRYPVALIDEFQDTDPVQYGIFSSIYQAPAGEGLDRGILFLIGDPKQAIYSFRGADIFAYMRAASALSGNDKRHILTRNWRSAPELVLAVNTVFSRAAQPFIFQEIPFKPVRAASSEQGAMTINGRHEPPFQLWFIPRPPLVGDRPPAKQMPKTEARHRILSAVAAEISRLLKLGAEKRALINNRELLAADIAILVRTNMEARQMQARLAACRIPSVLHSAENLFLSAEAFELEVVLKAIADPGSEQKTRAALATGILGTTGAELDRHYRDDPEHSADNAWERRLLMIRRYHEIWSRDGFIRMFRILLADNNTGPRLLACPDGERRLTNLYHLGELLHQAAADRSPGINALLGHLAEQRAGRESANEEYQLRLESDAGCVRIVTVHKAKGLEYPVVFCPFAWEGPRLPAKDEYLFHRPAPNPEETGGYQLTLDLGSVDAERHGRLAAREKLAEDLRLLYVALTRARCRCYLIWGAFNGAEKSGLAYLLHQQARPGDPGQLWEDTVGHVKKLGDEEILLDLENLCRAADNAIQVTVIEEKNAAARQIPLVESASPVCRQFQGKISPGWKISSFSSLTVEQGRQARADAEQPDRDTTLEATAANSLPAPAAGAGIFHFPHGIRAGNFFHDLLEHLDYTLAGADGLIREKLLAHGFDPAWQEAVQETVDNLRCIPLVAGRPDLTLSALTRQRRLNELEFYFPLAPISPTELQGLFSRHSRRLPPGFCEQIGRLTFSPARGFMKGYIDLVCELDNRYFLVDWKSNSLGNSLDDYCADRLLRAMNRGFYTLQYHIYTLALHQHLRARLPAYDYDRHFGGVIYVFLRGIDRGRGLDSGFFQDRPAAGLVAELADRLILGNQSPLAF